MTQHVDHEKAMGMFNEALKEMKNSLNELDKMGLKGTKKTLAKQMHSMYEELEESISNFDQTDSKEHLKEAIFKLEVLQPAFILNYNELLD